MRNIETLISAQYIVPVRPRGEVLHDGAVAVDKGHIVGVMPRLQALEKFRAEEQVHLARHILLPGLINAHTHSPMSLFKGVGGGLPMRRWLHECIFPLERDFLTPQFVRDGAELAIAEMIRGGATCFNDMYYFPEDIIDVACHARIRICCGLTVLEFATAYAAGADEYIGKGLEVRDQYKDDGRVHFMFAPHAPYTVSDKTLMRIRTYSDELNLPVHIHLHETAGEIADSIKEFGVRPMARLDQLGLVTPALRAVHMTQLTEEEIALLAERNAQVLHCPESNMKLASGICPVRALLEHGVNVALGTDSAASNDDLDILGEMRTAALLAGVAGGDGSGGGGKGVGNNNNGDGSSNDGNSGNGDSANGSGGSGDNAVFNPATALEMATINGATALGLGEVVGSIEKGKAADFAAVQCDSIEAVPVYDAIGHLVYSASRSEVSDVWIAGQRVLRDRVLTTIDEQALLKKSAGWRRKIAVAAARVRQPTQPTQ